jgi:cytochrome P450
VSSIQAVNAGGKVDLLGPLKELRKQGPVVFGIGCRFGDLEIPPVFRIEGMRSALVMDYDGVTQVLREEGFRHAFYPEFGAAGTLIHLNGEPHRRYRQLLTAVFAPRSIRTWEENSVPPVLKVLLTRLDEKRRADLLPTIVQPYPAMVFRSIMGLPEEDTDRVRALAILEDRGRS